MSLNLPKSTETDRFVAKTSFYKQPGMTPKLQDLIEQQIDRIVWKNKVAPATMDISSGDIAEFQVFEIKLSAHELDSAVLVCLQKSVPYPIVFVVHGGKGSQAAAVTASANGPVVLSTGWQSGVSLEPKGDSTDTLYKNYLLQISPRFAAVDGDTEKLVRAAKLKRTIDALTAKSRKETDIPRRQGLARERHDLELELKELLG
ncbi:MAG TPA: DUF4391 domain-containing protein [Candidatus Saccharimonadales bacterium]|jgi:hypothetical protein